MKHHCPKLRYRTAGFVIDLRFCFWWFKSSGMWRCVDGCVAPDVSEDPSTFVFNAPSFLLLGRASPHCTILSTLSLPCSNEISAYVLLLTWETKFHTLYVAATRTSYVVVHSTDNFIRWRVASCSSAPIYPGNVVIMEQYRAFQLALWRRTVPNKMKRAWVGWLTDFWVSGCWREVMWESHLKWCGKGLPYEVTNSIMWGRPRPSVFDLVPATKPFVGFSQNSVSGFCTESQSAHWQPFVHESVNEFIASFNQFKFWWRSGQGISA